MTQEFTAQQLISAKGQVIRQNTNTILFDDSLQEVAQIQASLKAFAQLEAPAKALLLADLDEDTEKHQALGQTIASLAPELTIFHGKTIQHALAHNPKACYFPDKFSLHNWLMDRKFENTHVLILGGTSLNISTVLQFV